MRKTVVCWNIQPFQSNFGVDLFKTSIPRPLFRSVLIWTYSLNTGPVEQADVFCLHLISLQSYVPSELLREPAGMKPQLGGQSPNVQLQYEKQSVSKKKTTHNTSTKLGRGSQRASSPSDLLLFLWWLPACQNVSHTLKPSHTLRAFTWCALPVCAGVCFSQSYICRQQFLHVWHTFRSFKTERSIPRGRFDTVRLFTMIPPFGLHVNVNRGEK